MRHLQKSLGLVLLALLTPALASASFQGDKIGGEGTQDVGGPDSERLSHLVMTVEWGEEASGEAPQECSSAVSGFLSDSGHIFRRVWDTFS